MKNMIKLVKESKFGKWLAANKREIFGWVIGIAIVVGLFCYALEVGKARTNAIIKLHLAKISDISKAQAATIKSLTEESNLLKKKVKRLAGRKMQEKDNVKNYILTYYKTVAPIIADELAVRIIEKSTKHNVPFVAVIAVTEVESHFNPFAISKRGARGPMQVMPRIWCKELNLSSKYDLHDIEIGIDSGVKILRRYLDATDNNMRKALYKYVGGDHSYIKRVYESMGKFIVFKSFTDIKVSAEENELDRAENNAADNDKIESKIDIKPKAEEEKEIAKSNIMFTHIIKKGQLLGDLAKWYTGSVNNWPAISEANPNIIPNRMPIGSVIIIPTKLLKVTKLMR